MRGNGRAFTAGADLAAFTDGGGVDRAGTDAGRVMAEAITAMQAVTVAAIHGHCVGGGVVLAATCDLRVAAEDVRFVIPEVDLGIPLAWGGIPRLVREVGPAATRDLVMTCRPFGAAEAQALGFVNRDRSGFGVGGGRHRTGLPARRQVGLHPASHPAERWTRPRRPWFPPAVPGTTPTHLPRLAATPSRVRRPAATWSPCAADPPQASQRCVRNRAASVGMSAHRTEA